MSPKADKSSPPLDDLDHNYNMVDIALVHGTEQHAFVMRLREELFEYGVTSCNTDTFFGTILWRPFDVLNSFYRNAVNAIVLDRGAFDEEILRHPSFSKLREPILYQLASALCAFSRPLLFVVNGTSPFPEELVPTVTVARDAHITDIVKQVFRLSFPCIRIGRAEWARTQACEAWWKQSITQLHLAKPFRVMLFGPSNSTASVHDRPLAQARMQLQKSLELAGCFAVLGEDFTEAGMGIDRDLPPSIKEKILAPSCDAVVVIAGSHGTSGELGFISAIAHVAARTIVAINDDHRDGFVAKGLCAEIEAHGGEVIYFTHNGLFVNGLHDALHKAAMRLITRHLSNATQQIIPASESQSH